MNPPHFFRALSGWLMQVSTKNPMEVFHCIGKMTTLQVQIDIDLNIPVCYWFFFKQSVFSLDFKKKYLRKRALRLREGTFVWFS